MEKNTSNKSCESGSCGTKSCFSCKSMMPFMLIMILAVIGWVVAYTQFSKTNYDRDQFTKATPTITPQAENPAPVITASAPADVDTKFKTAQNEAHAMKQDGMKTVSRLYPDLAFVQSAKQGTAENIVWLGDEDWLYSKTYNTTVIVCNHLNTPAYVFKGTTITTAELAKTKEMMQEALKMMNSGTMMPESGSMMQKEGKSGAMMKKETGYQSYSPALVASALKEGQKVAIFFHASWCPNCRALEDTIKASLSQIPANTLIVKADYDTETALKQKYGVTVQTTVVTLKSDGSLDKKILGPTSVSEILN